MIVRTGDISDRAVCEAVASRPDGVSVPEVIQERFSCHPKVSFNAIYRAADRGYIDYGVSINVPWLEPKGKDLLATQP